MFADRSLAVFHLVGRKKGFKDNTDRKGSNSSLSCSCKYNHTIVYCMHVNQLVIYVHVHVVIADS